MKKAEKQRPLPLLRNVRYPTYQLWAIAGEINNQDDVLKICILQTMQWLRERFREHELPAALDLPLPGSFEKVDFSRFTNVKLMQGYHLEIIWLDEEKSWAMQLTEPDLGPAPGKSDQLRRPVAGRIFETNISYQQTLKGILCGFQTIVSEPVGTTEICEVFRLGVIKELKRNPLVGLQQVWELKEEPHVIQSTTDIKRFSKKLMSKKRSLPIVVVAEYIPSNENTKVEPAAKFKNIPEDILDLHKVLNSSRYTDYTSQLNLRSSTKEEITVHQKTPPLPDWLDKLAYERMGYAHIFTVSDIIREEFCKIIGCELSSGGAVFLPSPQTNESATVYSHEDVSNKGFYALINEITQNYSKDRHFDSLHCRYVPQAQKIQMEKMLKDIHTEADLRKLYEEKLTQLKDQDSKREAEIEGDKQRAVRKLELELEKSQKKQKTTEEDSNLQRMKMIMLNTENENLLHRLSITKNRPTKPVKVCDWAMLHFGSQMIIHERAERLMKEIRNEEVDINLLCDSLEFLANEYWDLLNGIIDLNECQRLCSLYYNRPFEVGECGEQNIRNYPEDYVISHKNTNVELTHHLKVGKDSKHLVRIYFHYDKADQTILIGSMPKHLRTISYQ